VNYGKKHDGASQPKQHIITTGSTCDSLSSCAKQNMSGRDFFVDLRSMKFF